MKIQEQDIYHGPALMQIAEHKSFKALNKADERYGHYLVNADIRLWAKHSTAGEGPWSFTFHPTDLEGLRDDLETGASVYVALTCGHHTICCLSAKDLETLIDLDDTVQQWVRVEAPAGKQMRVTGSLSSKQPLLVAHNSFPNRLF